MAKGNVSEAIKEIEEKKRGFAESGNRVRRTYFRLQDGESAVVRFLEQGDELNWAWVHQLPPTGGSKVGRKVPCRDQGESGEPTGEPCPGCERGDKRTFQGAINLIWRDAPIIERDDNNRVVRDSTNRIVTSGTADALAVWVQGITVFEELEDLDGTYSGLTSRDFIVKRKGSMLNTRYSITPHNPDGGPQELSKNDSTLSMDRYDLTEFVVPPTYEAWGKAFVPTSETTNTSTVSNTSPFKRSRD